MFIGIAIVLHENEMLEFQPGCAIMKSLFGKMKAIYKCKQIGHIERINSAKSRHVQEYAYYCHLPKALYCWTDIKRLEAPTRLCVQ